MAEVNDGVGEEGDEGPVSKAADKPFIPEPEPWPFLPPINRFNFLEAVPRTFAKPENRVMKRVKPRVSNLASCARSSAYMMAGVGLDEGRGDGKDRKHSDRGLTQEQGRMFEDITVAVVPNVEREWGGGPVGIGGRQVCIGHAVCSPEHEQGPLDFWATGHPDGQFYRIIENNGAAPEDPWQLEDGRRWGFEHKHIGRWKYERIAQWASLADGAPDYVLQVALYGVALGWDAAYAHIVSQDASSVRSDATNNLRSKNPKNRWAAGKLWHPKVMDFVVDLKPLYTGIVAVARTRARWLTEWAENDGDPRSVAREFDPTVRAKNPMWDVDENGQPFPVNNPAFPCGWCPYLQRCLEDGQSGEWAPHLGFQGEHDFE